MRLQQTERSATLDQWETQQYRTDAASRQRAIGELARRAATAKQPWRLIFADGEFVVIGPEGVQQRSAGLPPPAPQPTPPASRRGTLGWLFVAFLILVNLVRYDAMMKKQAALPPRVTPTATATPAIEPSAQGQCSNANSIFSRSPSDRHRLAVTVGRYLTDWENYTPEEFIAAAEQARAQFPQEWVVFDGLCDNYQTVKRYGDALLACQRMYDLCPDNILSSYALGTEYNLLTRAAWSQFEIEALKDWLRQNPSEAALLNIDPPQERQLAARGAEADWLDGTSRQRRRRSGCLSESWRSILTLKIGPRFKKT